MKILFLCIFSIVGIIAIIVALAFLMWLSDNGMSLKTLIKRKFYIKKPEYGLLKEIDRLEKIAESKKTRTCLLCDTEEFLNTVISKKMSNSKDEAVKFSLFTLKTLEEYSVSNDTKAYVLASLFCSLYFDGYDFFDDDSFVYNNYAIKPIRKGIKIVGLTVKNSENNTVCNFDLRNKISAGDFLLEIFTMIVNGQIDTKTSVCTKVKK